MQADLLAVKAGLWSRWGFPGLRVACVAAVVAVAGPELVRVHQTFTNRRLIPADLFADGDRVVARVHASMDPTGPLAGVAPTGRHVETEHLHIWRVADDRLIEHWTGRDDFGLLQQLGAPTGAP